MKRIVARMTAVAGLVLASIALAYAPVQKGSDPLDPVREARVQALGKQLRCPVCQGESIADSPAQMARAQMDRVRELVTEGKTDEEIRQYFVDRYGEWALLEPPAHGANWLVWLGPGVMVLGGLVVIARLIKKNGGQPAAAEANAAPPSPAQTNTDAPSSGDPYLDAVRRELSR